MCLMELYAQNNDLVELSEINYVRELPKLMVVNLAGNSLCDSYDYRLYTIYCLRKLKVHLSKSLVMSYVSLWKI